MSGKNTYDISPAEREVKEWKAAKRLELRNEYLRELQDPKRTEAMMDIGFQRFHATRMHIDHYYTPNIRNIVPGLLFIALVFTSSKVLNKRRAKREHLYRTGQVSYMDRLFKFR